MVLGRRRVLQWLGVSLAALLGIAWLRRRGLVPWLVSAALADDTPRPLRADTAACLRATVLALLDPRVEPEHYVEFFGWRAERVPGAAALYDRFARTMDGAARARGADDFVRAPRDVQRRLLAGLGRPSSVERIRRIVLDRDRARFSRHIVRQVFRRFAYTDAWVLAGYAAWPGMPRSVANLRRTEPRS